MPINLHEKLKQDVLAVEECRAMNQSADLNNDSGKGGQVQEDEQHVNLGEA